MHELHGNIVGLETWCIKSNIWKARTICNKFSCVTVSVQDKDNSVIENYEEQTLTIPRRLCNMLLCCIRKTQVQGLKLLCKVTVERRCHASLSFNGKLIVQLSHHNCSHPQASKVHLANRKIVRHSHAWTNVNKPPLSRACNDSLLFNKERTPCYRLKINNKCSGQCHYSPWCQMCSATANICVCKKKKTKISTVPPRLRTSTSCHCVRVCVCVCRCVKVPIHGCIAAQARCGGATRRRSVQSGNLK